MLTIKIRKDQKEDQSYSMVIQPRTYFIYGCHHFTCLQGIKLHDTLSKYYVLLKFHVFSFEFLQLAVDRSTNDQNCPKDFLFVVVEIFQ